LSERERATPETSITTDQTSGYPARSRLIVRQSPVFSWPPRSALIRYPPLLCGGLLMRKCLIPLLIVLFVVPLFGSDSPKEYDGKTESVGIEGKWRLIELELNGLKDEPVHQEEITVRSGTYTINNDSGTIRKNYRLDTTQKPPHLDWILPSGETLKFIYQIDGDRLRVAVNTAINKRPQEFKGLFILVATYKRVK
jgi:uncharacterized protein (TIGR03067 family)